MAIRLTEAEPVRHGKLVGIPMKFCFFLTLLAGATQAQLLAPPPPPGQTEIRPDTVVATINGVSVTVADIKKIMANAPPDLVRTFQSNPQQAIAGVYLYKTLAEDAKKTHLDEKSPYKEQIQEVVEQATQIALANVEINNEHDGYSVSAEQIEEYYKKNQSRWQEAAIKIILVAFKPDGAGAAKPNQTSEEGLKEITKGVFEQANALNQRSEADAEKLANSLVSQLRKGGDFAKLVSQYSDDAESKAAGGDFGLPIKSNSTFAPELKKAVFSMKPGDISDPVRQGSGFYIIKLQDLKTQALNDVRGTIVTEIRDQHLRDYMGDLNTRFTPQVQRPDFFIQPGKYLADVPEPAGK